MNWPVALFVVGCVLPLGIPLWFLCLRWRLKSKSDSHDGEERLLAKQLAYAKATHGRRFTLMVLVCVMLSVSGYERSFGSPEIGLGLGIGYLLFFGVWAWWPLWSRRQRLSLEDRHYLVCPKCGCDLRGAGHRGVCPECNFPYTQELLKGVWTRALRRGLRS